jgi:hypothetical protein
MSRESRAPEAPDINNLPAIAEQFVFKPSGLMRAMKAKFMVRTQDNPLVDVANLTQRELIAIVGHKTLIETNWSKPGFKDWLFNREESKEKLEELFDLALDSIRTVLLSEDVKTASAKVNILKILGELLDKFPKAGQTTKDPMANLSKEELERFLEKSGIRIEKQIILDTK